MEQTLVENKKPFVAPTTTTTASTDAKTMVIAATTDDQKTSTPTPIKGDTAEQVMHYGPVFCAIS
jgi:hypothetical protein